MSESDAFKAYQDFHPEKIYVTSEQYKVIKHQKPNIPFKLEDDRIANALTVCSLIKKEEKIINEKEADKNSNQGLPIYEDTGQYLLTLEGEYYLDYRRKAGKESILNEIKSWIPLVIAIIGLLSFSSIEIHKTKVWQTQITEINKQFNTQIADINKYWQSYLIEINQQLISQIINKNIQVNNISNYSVPKYDEGEYSDDTFIVEAEVRLSGSEDKSWYKSVEAQIGDRVEFLIGYYNISDLSQKDVGVRAILSDNLKYVDGSTILRNSNHIDGVIMNSNKIADGGIKIGSYASKVNAYITFTAEVINGNLKSGVNSLTNYVQVGIGDNTIDDSAVVFVTISDK